MKGSLNQANLPKKAPEYLGSIGKAMWRYLAPFLNESKKTIRADQYLVAQYCSTYEIYRKAYADVQKHGIQQAIYKTSLSPVDGSVVSKDFQGYKKNPAYNIMSDALSKMNQMGKELGLSPRARSQLMKLKSADSSGQTLEQSMKKFFSK